VQLLSSNLKPIITVPHIINDIRLLQFNKPLFLDGELYCHGMPLQDIVGITSSRVNKKPAHIQRQIRYSIFDINYLTPEARPIETYYANRKIELDRLASSIEIQDTRYLDIVTAYTIKTLDEGDKFYNQFVSEGYEGAMYKPMGLFYYEGRSPLIFKRKDFQDSEFDIVNAVMGEGKLTGCIASFECRLASGATFHAPMNGTQDYLASLANDPTPCQNTRLTVRYLELSKDGVPTIPRGVVIRDYE
jgi:ATP-dependent DNA ligase